LGANLFLTARSRSREARASLTPLPRPTAGAGYFSNPIIDLKLGIPPKVIADSEGNAVTIPDDPGQTSKRSDAGPLIVEEVIGFVKSKSGA
jgi:hypothetical protein